ncbi:protein kinase (plasmid) [Asticcacaulis sp. DW145]|uniref:protein kinase domain-containing protein n=1 Tax=Asticcacaulis sp. DW145 TaxID=3095608 RepID=UPI003086621B|nr:protein kinase [Asticcacaulis sp. DW145]
MAILFAGRSATPSEFVEVPDVVVASNGRHYEIGDRIDAGGNGVVHQCTDVADGGAYAIKFQLDLRNNRRLRFAREQELISSLHHDHLIVYDNHGQIDGIKKRRGHAGGKGVTAPTDTTLPFIVMGLANSNLTGLVKSNSVQPEVFTAQFRGLAHALGELHKKAVHRDIKPDNILVIGDRWVLSDYGLCHPHDLDEADRFTPDWEVVGPRYWMSPEANNRSIGRSDVISPASDVFQLASVFWFVVNRSHPTGILTRSDWQGPDALFDPIFEALHHDITLRPSDGTEFAAKIDAAIHS